MYFIKTGQVKTLKTTAGGKELITGLYGPGEFFGYPPLLENTPHQDSAVVVADAELVYIPKDDFTLLLRDPAVGRQFIRLLAGRVSEREAQLLGMAYSFLHPLARGRCAAAPARAGGRWRGHPYPALARRFGRRRRHGPRVGHSHAERV